MFKVFKKLKVCFKVKEVEEPVTKKKVGFIKVEELIAESIADSMGKKVKVAESVEKVVEELIAESMGKVESIGEQIGKEVEKEIESNIQVSEIILTEVVDFMGESVEKVVNEN